MLQKRYKKMQDTNLAFLILHFHYFVIIPTIPLRAALPTFYAAVEGLAFEDVL